MKSRWYEHKAKAVALRRSGNSLRGVERVLGIPRSTLSGWFRDVKLSKKFQKQLYKNWLNALTEARKKAVLWHNKQKENRLKQAELKARESLKKIRNTKQILELALAFLYLGEGNKKSPTTSIGSSDPLILKFFIKSITTLYKVDIEKIKCFLHLRADQSPSVLSKYWSRELGIPLKNFGKTSIDIRTKGIKTYDYYKGVCVLSCGLAKIQRKLIYLAKFYCDTIIKN